MGLKYTKYYYLEIQAGYKFMWEEILGNETQNYTHQTVLWYIYARNDNQWRWKEGKVVFTGRKDMFYLTTHSTF